MKKVFVIIVFLVALTMHNVFGQSKDEVYEKAKSVVEKQVSEKYNYSTLSFSKIQDDLVVIQSVSPTKRCEGVVKEYRVMSMVNIDGEKTAFSVRIIFDENGDWDYYGLSTL